MAKLLSGKVLHRQLTDTHIDLANAEPFLGKPDSDFAVILSDTQGNRSFFTFDDVTMDIDSATNTISVATANVVNQIDSQISVTSIGNLFDVDLTNLQHQRILKYDSDVQKFIVAIDQVSSAGDSDLTLEAISVVKSGGFGTLIYSDVSGVFDITFTDSQQITSVLKAGLNVVYDSATGTISVPTVRPDGVDSQATSDLVDSAYVQLRVPQTYIDTLDTHDSVAVQQQIDSTVTQSLIDTFDTHDSVAVQGQIDATLANDIIFGGDLDLADGKTIQFDNEGQIYSFSNELRVTGGVSNGLVKIYYGGSTERLRTTASGVSVYGDVTTSADLNVDSNLTVGGYLAGPATFTIDPAGVGDSTGKVVILGDLQVDGTTTTINSTTVSISDKNIILADSAQDSSQANGAGITVNGANATITYTSANDRWTLNKAPYYNGERLLTDTEDLHDSALIQGQIDSNFANDIIFGGDLDLGDAKSIQFDGEGSIASVTNQLQIKGGATEGTVRLYHGTATERLRTTDSGVTIQGNTDIVGNVDITGTTTIDNVLTLNDSNGSGKASTIQTIDFGGDGILKLASDNVSIRTYDSDLVLARFKKFFIDFYSDSTGEGKFGLRINRGFTRVHGTLRILDSAGQDSAAQLTHLGSGNLGLNGVRVLTADEDLHDSAAVDGQIDSSINNDILGTANEVEVTASGGVATIGLPADVQITTSLSVAGNDVLTTATDTHDSAAVQGQIDSNRTNDTTFVRVAGDEVTGNIKFVDNVEARFGNGGTDPYDFRIYHNGTANQSYIRAGETNSLVIGAETLFLTDKNLSTTLKINASSNTELYYNKTKVADTTSTGMSFSKLAADSASFTGKIAVGGHLRSNPTAQNAGAGLVVVNSTPHENMAQSIDYTIHAKDTNGSTTKGETQITRILATFDSAGTVAFTEFGTVFTGDSVFGDFDVTVSGANINLNFTRRSTRDGTINIKPHKTIIRT